MYVSVSTYSCHVLRRAPPSSTFSTFASTCSPRLLPAVCSESIVSFCTSFHTCDSPSLFESLPPAYPAGSGHSPMTCHGVFIPSGIPSHGLHFSDSPISHAKSLKYQFVIWVGIYPTRVCPHIALAATVTVSDSVTASSQFCVPRIRGRWWSAHCPPNQVCRLGLVLCGVCGVWRLHWVACFFTPPTPDLWRAQPCPGVVPVLRSGWACAPSPARAATSFVLGFASGGCVTSAGDTRGANPAGDAPQAHGPSSWYPWGWRWARLGRPWLAHCIF
jgi:hypothetical protein